MNFGKEIKRAIRTAEGRRRIFFRFFLLIVLGNVFYFPEGYADRFFTPGMLWTGIAVGVSGMLFPFVVSGRVGLPGLACVAVGILAVVVGGKSAGGFFAWQTAAWGGAMWLLFVMTGYFSAWGKPADWYGGLSFVGAVEAFAGIGQYAGIWPVYSASFPVTGTFDNPAGLAACLAICFPAALYFMASRPVGAKVWGGLSALSMGAAVVLSGSRTGMVAVGCLAATSVYRFFLGGRWPAWRVRAAFVSVGAVMLVGLYCWKKDSADGRLLVWNCSLEMLADAPLTGHGPDAFQAEYMDYQAGWLAEHPEEKWERLAGNVRHPFNEYLRIAVEYGVAGLLLVAGVIWLLWRWYRRCRPEDRPLYRSIGGAGICGLFSYPLNYPAVCVLLVLLLGVIVRGRPVCFYGGRWFKTGIGALAVAVLAVTLYWNRAEREWHRISCLSLNGRTEEVLTDYARLYPFMLENPLFLYNYGAELHVAGLWTASLSILTECVRGLNDMDVQMLLADNYSRLGEYDRAERHYRRAARMCPNRFMPLYRLVKLYGQTGRDAEARQLAGEIIVKPVKVPSFRVDRMKREMEKYLRKP